MLKVPETSMMGLLIWKAYSEGILGAWGEEEVVDTDHVFDNAKEDVAAVAVQSISGGEVDLAGIVKGATVRKRLFGVFGVEGEKVGDLFSLRVDYSQPVAFLKVEGRAGPR